MSQSQPGRSLEGPQSPRNTPPLILPFQRPLFDTIITTHFPSLLNDSQTLNTIFKGLVGSFKQKSLEIYDPKTSEFSAKMFEEEVIKRVGRILRGREKIEAEQLAALSQTQAPESFLATANTAGSFEQNQNLAQEMILFFEDYYQKLIMNYPSEKTKYEKELLLTKNFLRTLPSLDFLQFELRTKNNPQYGWHSTSPYQFWEISPIGSSSSSGLEKRDKETNDGFIVYKKAESIQKNLSNLLSELEKTNWKDCIPDSSIRNTKSGIDYKNFKNSFFYIGLYLGESDFLLELPKHVEGMKNYTSGVTFLLGNLRALIGKVEEKRDKKIPFLNIQSKGHGQKLNWSESGVKLKSLKDIEKSIISVLEQTVLLEAASIDTSFNKFIDNLKGVKVIEETVNINNIISLTLTNALTKIVHNLNYSADNDIAEDLKDENTISSTELIQVLHQTFISKKAV